MRELTCMRRQFPLAQEVHRMGQPTCMRRCLHAGSGAGRYREERAVIPRAPYATRWQHASC